MYLSSEHATKVILFTTLDKVKIRSDAKWADMRKQSGDWSHHIKEI